MNLPNFITLARLIAVPITVWLILQNELALAFWIFVGAGISDAVDGFLARYLNARTTLGSYLDPLADKILLVSVYVALGYTGHLADWLVILVVFRDVMIVGGVLLVTLLSGEVEMRPLFVSKLNTTMQIVLAALVLAHFGYAFDLPTVQAVLSVVVAGTTVLSGAAYMRQLVRRTPIIEDQE